MRSGGAAIAGQPARETFQPLAVLLAAIDEGTEAVAEILAIGVVDPANLINFSQIITNVASGTNVYVAAGNYLATIVHALEGTGRFHVVNRPVVFTSNNKKVSP